MERNGTERRTKTRNTRNEALSVSCHCARISRVHTCVRVEYSMALIVFRVSRSPLQTTEVLSLLLEPPADSISVYRPVKCTAEEKCGVLHYIYFAMQVSS